VPETNSPQSSPLVSENYRAELVAKGRAFYDSKLKTMLEPAHNGEYVALHVDSGDYAIGPTFRIASHTLQARHAKDGRVVGWKIGPDPDSDYLAMLVAAEMGQKHTR
jgi:hypothetical protein